MTHAETQQYVPPRPRESSLDPQQDWLLLGQPKLTTGGAATADTAAFTPNGLTQLARTRGDFACAHRAGNGDVTLAVDRFAMQTMCWREDKGRIEFAERADTLAAGSELDPQAIFDYLFFHAIPSPRTIWKGVHRLPPGHVLTARGGQVDVKPYWQPVFRERQQAGFEPLAAEFRGLLEAAVREQLDGGKPACFLSGGTDSSTIAGMIGRAAGRPAATYSIGFDAEGYDEMAFARLAARHFGTEHHEYYVTPADLVRGIPQVAASYDQPFGNSSALPAYYCARMAREDGVTRILAGDGGDELFGGNERYAKQRVFGLYDKVPHAARKALVEPLALSRLARSVPGLRKVASYVAQAKLGLPARLETYNLLHRLGIENILTTRFLQAVDLHDPARQQQGVWKQAVCDSTLNRQLAFDWRYTLAEADLPKVRGTAALAGVAVGFPMLDQRLVDFSATLPDNYKLRGTRLRWFFKEALRGFLPDEIISKKKQGFGLPFGPWLLKDAALHSLAADSLRGLAERGIVQSSFVENLLRVQLPQHPGFYGEMVWILMMLEQWLRAHAPAYKV